MFDWIELILENAILIFMIIFCDAAVFTFFHRLMTGSWWWTALGKPKSQVGVTVENGGVVLRLGNPSELLQQVQYMLTGSGGSVDQMVGDYMDERIENTIKDRVQVMLDTPEIDRALDEMVAQKVLDGLAARTGIANTKRTK